MKKLLVISPQLPYPATDGGKISIYYPLINFSTVFDVHFAFIDSKPVSETVLSHFHSFKIKVYHLPLDTRDTAFGLLKNVFSYLPYKFQKYCTSNNVKRLARLVQYEKIDFVWCNHAHVAWYGRQLKKRHDLKIFLREHNLEYSLVQQAMEVTGNKLLKTIINWQYIKTRRYEVECWHAFNKTFFISDYDYEKALELYESCNKVDILYDSFYESTAKYKRPKEKRSFIFTGNVDSFQNSYNLRVFLKDIWVPLVEKDSSWKLYITGNDENRLRKSLKLDYERYNIVNLGFVQNVEEVIASKKYFISPSYIGSGVRIKVLNAMASGAVCFLTTLDSQMLNIFSDFKNIVSFCSFNNFYEKLIRLEEDDELYNSISLHALEVRSMFSWKDYAVKVFNEITSI